MKCDNYILVDKEPVQESDILKWGKWFENSKDRFIATDYADVLFNGKNVGKIKVSTIFLGIDHNYNDKGSLILFETVVFGGALDQEMERCSTYGEALIQHKLMKERVKLSVSEM